MKSSESHTPWSRTRNAFSYAFHDRASLGGMLIANGVAVWLSAQWGFRAGARWLWVALAWGGNIAFACATIVHIVVGYHSPLHLAPAMCGATMRIVAIITERSVITKILGADASRGSSPLARRRSVRRRAGFSVHNEVVVQAGDGEGLERLARYLARRR